MIGHFFRGIGLAVVAALMLAFVPALFGGYGLYWERWATSLLTRRLDPAFDRYQPLETVIGNFHAPVPAVRAGAHPFPEAALEAAAAYAAQHGSDALLVAWRGRLVHEQYWNGRAPDSLFAAHSMLKVLPAILIGLAIADGYIESPDVSAAVFLPEWNDAEHRGITIRHLLNMSSGMQDTYDFKPGSMHMQRAMGLDIVAANLAVEIRDSPGRVFAHHDPNAALLGIIVERATGRRIADYLSEKLWRPIGAHDAFLFVDRPGGTAHTDCCSWSAIQDWIRVGELIRNKGIFYGRQVVPAGWIEEMMRPSGANPNFGMQLWLGTEWEEYRRYDSALGIYASWHSEPFAADDVVFLDGLGKRQLYIVPSRELVILRTGPNDSGWDDSRLPNILIRALQGKDAA